MGAKNQLTEALEKSQQTEETPAAKTSGKQPPSRTGKKQISGYFPVEVHTQLKMLSVKKNTSIETLLGNAINLLFIEEDEPPIA